MLTKKFLLTLGSIVTVSILVFLVFCNRNTDMGEPLESPNWRGITPGVTTENQVREILGDADVVGILNLDGDPDFPHLLREIQLCLCGQKFYIYNLRGITVYFRSGKVWALSLGFSSLPGRMNVSDLVELYGKPEFVTWSRRMKTDNSVVFASKGVLARVHGTPHRDSATVMEMLYFSPMPLNKVIEEFWKEISLTEPPTFPQDDLAPAQKDPWGFNQ